MAFVFQPLPAAASDLYEFSFSEIVKLNETNLVSGPPISRSLTDKIFLREFFAFSKKNFFEKVIVNDGTPHLAIWEWDLEKVKLTESFSATKTGGSVTNNVTDKVLLKESKIISAIYGRNFSDIVKLRETITKGIFKTLAEKINLVEAKLNSITKFPTEIVKLSEQFSRAAIYKRSFIDVEKIIDNLHRGFTLIQFESIKLRETFARGVTYSIFLTEVEKFSDSRFREIGKIQNEIIKFSEVFSRAAIYSRSFVDTELLIDNRYREFGKFTTDVIKLRESISLNYSYGKSLTEIVKLSEFIAKKYSKVITDIVKLVDGNILRAINLSVFENVILSEAVSLAKIASSIAERILLKESFQVTQVGGAQAFSRSQDEIIKLRETFTRAAIYNRSFIETERILDNTKREFGLLRIERVLFKELFSRVATYDRSFFDTEKFSDARYREFGKIQSEKILLRDTLSKSAIYFKLLAEKVFLVEDKTIAISGQGRVEKQDIVKLRESFLSSAIYNKTLIETFKLSDTRSNQVGKSMFEKILLKDSRAISAIYSRFLTEIQKLSDARYRAFDKTQIERIKLSDTLTRSAIYNRTFVDIEKFSDNRYRAFSKVQNERIFLREILSKSAIYNRLFAEKVELLDKKTNEVFKGIFDKILLKDAKALVATYNKFFVEIQKLSDSTNKFVSYNRIFSDKSLLVENKAIEIFNISADIIRLHDSIYFDKVKFLNDKVYLKESFLVGFSTQFETRQAFEIIRLREVFAFYFIEGLIRKYRGLIVGVDNYIGSIASVQDNVGSIEAIDNKVGSFTERI